MVSQILTGLVDFLRLTVQRLKLEVVGPGLVVPLLLELEEPYLTERGALAVQAETHRLEAAHHLVVVGALAVTQVLVVLAFLYFTLPGKEDKNVKFMPRGGGGGESADQSGHGTALGE